MLAIFRLAHWAYEHNIPLLPRLLYVMNRLLFAVVLPPSTKVGRNVVFGYSGLGIVVHGRCSIGTGVHIGTHVTLGGRSGMHGVPKIDDDVQIGTGARIPRPVTVGRGARIGANAVVLEDVPAGATAVGIPARILHKPASDNMISAAPGLQSGE